MVKLTFMKRRRHNVRIYSRTTCVTYNGSFGTDGQDLDMEELFMNKILQEITDWGDNTPNHTYEIRPDGKCVAYQKVGSDEWHRFSKPLRFERSRRKFKTIGTVSFD